MSETEALRLAERVGRCAMRAFCLWLASRGREGHNPKHITDNAVAYESFILDGTRRDDTDR